MMIRIESVGLVGRKLEYKAATNTVSLGRTIPEYYYWRKEEWQLVASSSGLLFGSNVGWRNQNVLLFDWTKRG